MATRWARVARGLVAASFAVFVAAFAHVAGGGELPSSAGLALAFCFALLTCIALAGRRVSRLRIAASVILSQGALHLLFIATGGGHPAFTALTTTMDMPGMSTSIHLAASTAMPSMYANGWMWLAHAAAAVVTMVVLFWAESAFWGVYETARMAFTRVLRIARLHPLPRPAALPAALSWRIDRREAQFLLTGLRHRGPPLAAAASV